MKQNLYAKKIMISIQSTGFRPAVYISKTTNSMNRLVGIIVLSALMIYFFVKMGARLFCRKLTNDPQAVPVANPTSLSATKPASVQLKPINVHHAQEGFVNLDSARQSQIEALHSERGAPSLSKKSDEESRFGKVAASPNSQNLTACSIEHPASVSSESVNIQSKSVHEDHLPVSINIEVAQPNPPHLIPEIPPSKSIIAVPVSTSLVNHGNTKPGDKASLPEIRQPHPVIDPYNQLVCTEIAKQNIIKLIHAISHEYGITLLLRKAELEKIGDEIRTVHPLKFLGFILSNPTLKSDLRSIHGSTIRWYQLIKGRDGLAEHLTEQDQQKNILPYLNGFAKEVGAKPEDLQRFVSSHNWEGMLDFLM